MLPECHLSVALVLRPTQVTQAMAKCCILSGYNMGSEMLNRSLHYAKALYSAAGLQCANNFMHIHPEIVTSMLVEVEAIFQPQQTRTQPGFIKLNSPCILGWNSVYKKTWLQFMDDGYLLFLPVSFPSDDHWIVIVLWKKGDKYCIRVYNSLKGYREFDQPIALAAAQATEIMS